MPPLTRWFIKSAFVYFVAALLVGLALAVGRTTEVPPIVSAFAPTYFHLFMVGWVTQLIFGVAYWMFPVLSKQLPRGSESLGWATYWLLNAGLVMRLIFEPWLGVQASGVAGWGLVGSATLQWLAGMCFVINTWQRVKER